MALQQRYKQNSSECFRSTRISWSKNLIFKKMNKEKVEEELKKIWNEICISHSDHEKQAAWEEFKLRVFSSIKKKI